MAGSAAVATRKALLDGLAEHLGNLSDFNGESAPERRVEVAYAWQFGGELEASAERVFGNRTFFDTPPAALRAGRNFRNESGRFELIVRVEYIGGSAEDSDLRAYAIGAEVEEYVADRKNGEGLDVDGLQTLTIRSGEAVSLGNDNGSITEITYQVHWTARLT